MRSRAAHAVVLIALVACSRSEPTATATPQASPPWQAAGFVAHAFGSPSEGPIYTNSREAFEASYAKGFRAFETDLVLLEDNRILLAHDGHESHYGLPKDTTFDELTSDALRGRNYNGRYPVLFDDDLIELLTEHSDAVVLLDTKGDPETTQVDIARLLAKRAPRSVRARMIPHVHSEEQLGALRELDAFPDFILALYLWKERDVSEAPALVRAHELQTAIVRPQDYSDRLRRNLEHAGARWIFVHSFTTRSEIEPWRRKGLGVYSNEWISAP